VPSDRVRTLIVDDEPDIRRLWQVTMTTSPDFITVGIAENGEQGVSYAEGLQPDLVLLDVTMPRLDGVAALPRIRAAAPGAKVVFVTAVTVLATNEDRIAGAGADAVLLKTLSPSQLLDELRKVMAA
jgi:CheY-like chemotaxis protein